MTVVRRDERAQLYTSKQGLELQNVSGRYGPFFVAGAEAFVEPRADSGPEPMVHPGEELVVVLEGEMRFTVDGERLRARRRATRSTSAPRYPHSWRNPTDRPARAIWLAIRSA